MTGSAHEASPSAGAYVHWGSGKRVFYLTAGGLHDQRYLAALRNVGLDILYVYLIEGMDRYCLPGIPSVGLGYRPLLGSGPHRSILRMLRKVPLVPKVKRMIREYGPDIVHSGWIPTVGFWGALSGFHPFFLHCFGSDLRTRASDSWWIRQVARYTLSRVDAVTCDCLSTCELMVREYGVSPERVHHLHFGVDLDRFRPEPARREEVRRRLGWSYRKIVLHTRPLEPLYDPWTFLSAFRRVHARFPESRALLVGEGSLRSALVAQVGEWGLSSAVRFLGQVPHADLPGYLNAADVMVNCPVDDGSSYSIPEAMACGLPVVASDLPSRRGWIDHGRNGFLFTAGDVETLSTYLDKLLQDTSLAGRFSLEGHARAEVKADRVRNSRRFLDIYGGLLTKNRPHGGAPGSQEMVWTRYP